MHGGAGQACMQMIANGIDLARREAIPIREAAKRLALEAKNGGKRMPGIGHRLHTEDPRARVLFDIARQTNLAGEGIEFMQELEKAAREHIRPLPINVDGALAAVLFDLGFSPPRSAN
jgi:citrate synthase